MTEESPFAGLSTEVLDVHLTSAKEALISLMMGNKEAEVDHPENGGVKFQPTNIPKLKTLIAQLEWAKDGVKRSIYRPRV